MGHVMLDVQWRSEAVRRVVSGCEGGGIADAGGAAERVEDPAHRLDRSA